MSKPRPFSVTASALTNDVRDAPRRARVAGFSGLVFDAYSSGVNLTELSASGRREFGHMLSTEQQRLVGLRADLGPKGFGPGADVDRALSLLERAMEAAAATGAGCVCVDLGPLPAAPAQRKPKPTVTPEQAGLIILPPSSSAQSAPVEETSAPPPDPALVSQVASAMVELCARADRYRVTVALSSSLASLASLHKVIRDVDCPWFGVELDPVAVLRDEWDVDGTFSVLGPLVRHVRARDAVVGADRRSRPAVIGQGGVDWGRFMAALDEAGYAGFVTIDPTELADRARAAVAGLEHLTRV